MNEQSQELFDVAADIVRTAAGQPAKPDLIAGPGAYDVDLNRYHAEEICVEPSISASGLKILINQSPKHYWVQSTLNPKRKTVSKAAFRIGNAAHLCIMFGEKEVRDSFHVIPDDMNLNRKDGRAEKEKAAELKLEIIREADVQRVLAMARALEAHPYASQVFKNAWLEKTLVWNDPETGVWCRCRPDVLPRQMAHIPDYKTTIDANKGALEKQVWNFSYHIQNAFYCTGIKEALGVEAETVFYIFQEKEPPYCVSVVTLEREWLEWGDLQVRQGLRTFARCLERDSWPGYDSDPIELMMPAFARYELDRRHAAGEFTKYLPDSPVHQIEELDVEPEDLLTAG